MRPNAQSSKRILLLIGILAFAGGAVDFMSPCILFSLYLSFVSGPDFGIDPD